MSTPILKVITEYCLPSINDDELNALAREDAPLCARRAWGQLLLGIPLFNVPPTMQDFLNGTKINPKLIYPTYDTFQEITSVEIAEATTIDLGDEYKGYELFACRLVTHDDFGNEIYTPTDIVSYNADDGVITITPQTNNGETVPIPAGAIFDMDFYTDGYFTETLTPEMMNILSLCFKVKWLGRLFDNSIDLLPKIKDKSFDYYSPAQKEQADVAKLEFAKKELARELRRFEQNLAYKKAVPSSAHLI